MRRAHPVRLSRRRLQGHPADTMDRLGQDVDPNEIHLGKLYTVNLLHPCTHGAVLTSTVGEGLDGGYAEYVIVPEGQLVLVVCLFRMDSESPLN